VWTTLYDFFTKQVPRDLLLPNPIVSPSTGPSTVVTAVTPPAPRAVTDTRNPDLPDIFKTIEGDLEAALKGDPKGLPALVRGLIGTAILAASALSFIPGTNNFGGGLASVLIHDVIAPFRKAVYDGTIDLALRPLFPTSDLSPRLLVSGIEAGALSFDEVLEELSRSGTRPEAIQVAAKIAQVKRFDAETRDDFALVKTYNTELIKESIASLKDEEKAVIADLKARRGALVSELTRLQTSVTA
jgi:hypothetical protein